jgi:glycosyltransferase involved in cell wall biosynthesis
MASILDQSYRDLELVVVDDASRDDTVAVARSYAARDDRVRLLRLPVNVGTYVAKGLGLLRARGAFVTCHDSDDWAHPERLARQVAALRADPRVVFCTSHWVRMDDAGTYFSQRLYPLARLNPASPLFRREAVLAAAGGWDSVRTGADSEFLARLKLVFPRRAMARLDLPLTIGAHRPGSLMTAPATGQGPNGMSPVRLAYWEAWTAWHIAALRAGTAPALAGGPDRQRPFPAPAAIEVSRADIARCLESAAAD